MKHLFGTWVTMITCLSLHYFIITLYNDPMQKDSSSGGGNQYDHQKLLHLLLNLDVHYSVYYSLLLDPVTPSHPTCLRFTTLPSLVT
jgi:hypothetical protein